MVDQSETLSEVLVRFDEWLNSVVYPLVRQWREYYSQDPTSALCATNLKSEQSRFIYDEKNVDFTEEEKMICFATDGPWDMRHFMHECSVLRDKVEFPPLFYRFINVRHSYCQLFKTRQVKLTHMLRRMGMTFEGQRHSGLADSRNITRVLAELIARGYRCHHVSTIKYYHRGDAYLLIDQATRELLEEYGDEDKPSNGRKNKPKAKKSKKSKRK
ncbi:exonuclease [Angomonas deanei]|uniref:Exonuclease n=1 Tax=Angomonas deanei TaxID=59799 RepID=A0A7G2C0Z3_9TRYP|nr:exonuclease [Angomonas deanei]CAD2213390.1 hypothetical protein, conserved [Angomonas deanei]|eukprot:EPY40573.1 exonuclease [Angomonas deanei]